MGAAPPLSYKELASRVLEHPHGGVEGLLELSDRSENVWLEFKAATYPADGCFKDYENEADYHWHVAKSVIAMANSFGGVLFLGVDDGGNPVGLGPSDPKNIRGIKGKEAFLREVIMDQVLLPRGGWKCKHDGTLKLDHPEILQQLIELKEFTYRDKSILAILVDHIYDDQDFLLIQQSGNPPVTSVFIRERGEIGRVRELKRSRNLENLLISSRKSIHADGVLQGLWEKHLISVGQTPIAVKEALAEHWAAVQAQLQHTEEAKARAEEEKKNKEADELDWSVAKGENTEHSYSTYLDRHKEGQYRGAAEQRIYQLQFEAAQSHTELLPDSNLILYPKNKLIKQGLFYSFIGLLIGIAFTFHEKVIYSYFGYFLIITLIVAICFFIYRLANPTLVIINDQGLQVIGFGKTVLQWSEICDVRFFDEEKKLLVVVTNIPTKASTYINDLYDLSLEQIGSEIMTRLRRY